MIFSIKGLGVAKKIMGIEIIRDKKNKRMKTIRRKIYGKGVE